MRVCVAAPETWLVEPSRGEPHTTRSRTVTWEAGAGTANLAWTRQLQGLPADSQQAAGSAAGSAAHGARAARRGVGAARVGGGVRGGRPGLVHAMVTARRRAAWPRPGEWRGPRALGLSRRPQSVALFLQDTHAGASRPLSAERLFVRFLKHFH